MKYKVGDEVLIKAKIIEINQTEFPCLPYTVMVISEKQYEGIEMGSTTIRGINEDVIAHMTAEEAWEIARKILKMNCTEAYEVFGTAHVGNIFQHNSIQEAKAKIKAWEAKEEIKVGDVVFHPGTNKSCVVTNVNNNGYMHMTDKDGVYHICSDKTCLKKTGQHIDIQSVLNQIG